MEYLSIKQTSEKWGISVRRIQVLCSEDAFMYVWIWNLTFFACSSYRFVSIILSVLLKRDVAGKTERDVAYPYKPETENHDI